MPSCAGYCVGPVDQDGNPYHRMIYVLLLPLALNLKQKFLNEFVSLFEEIISQGLFDCLFNAKRNRL